MMKCCQNWLHVNPHQLAVILKYPFLRQPRLLTVVTFQYPCILQPLTMVVTLQYTCIPSTTSNGYILSNILVCPQSLPTVVTFQYPCFPQPLTIAVLFKYPSTTQPLAMVVTFQNPCIPPTLYSGCCRYNWSRLCVSGMYNSSEVQLHWEHDIPVTLAPELHMAEFDLLHSWTNETLVQADWTDPRHGGFSEFQFISKFSFCCD